MKVLVACEFSGKVRESFRAKGHDAWSCDIINAEPKSEYHIKGDVLEIINDNWDLIIAHPPCTYLCVSGARWWKGREQLQKDAIKFVSNIWKSNCKKVCIENPIGKLSKYLKPSQIIQPWMFGCGETKATCLWLRGLPKLKATEIVPGREPRIWKISGKNRSKLRSITYDGIANAMANQWG